ncbi:Os02g0138550 [Oryza sativa Japonica Group]|uniref:Os02g0138550 protein n=1 Tax=Oryza sativa subsp. japonica TaxID=39947 RepID=A0A0P0VEN1_ORYSJ|nr:Os02g0138550 [Oryza sativa Japonica Group]
MSDERTTIGYGFWKVRVGQPQGASFGNYVLCLTSDCFEATTRVPSLFDYSMGIINTQATDDQGLSQARSPQN